MFDYLNYKNRIPIDKCLIDIPKLNPESIKYQKFWLEEIKRKQIEGHWVEHGGEWKWLPGPVFQYVNLWRIEMKQADSIVKGKIIGKPLLRDLEWIKGYVHAVARGFSGFEDDDEYSCHKILINPDRDKLLFTLPKKVRNSLYNSKGEFKKYKKPLPYLYEYYDKCLGRPYYYNEALNVMEIGARNYGKTVWSGNMCGHNFLTDGVMDYEEWALNESKHKDDKITYTTQTLIGAIDAKYVNNLNKHLKVGLENLPGRVHLGNILYPPPLSKQTTGQWKVGSEVIARYEEKIGGRWEIKGSGSSFAFRSFNDNPFAANGLRYGFGLIDETGFMGNLVETLGQLHECTTVDGEKYGSIWMTGTGGDMDGGSTEGAKKVFYDPAAYECLEFEDIFEGKGSIGLFIPAWMAPNKFRDEFGNINKELALKEILEEREIAKNAKTKDAYYSLLQMKPLVPSEAFLLLEGNIFPVAELKEHLQYLESSEKLKDIGNIGWMHRDSSGNVYFKPDFDLIPADYPTKESATEKGAVVIWEEPIDGKPWGLYVIGVDPYDQDKADNSVSFGSCFVYKRFINKEGEITHLPVAEYTGRPDFANDFYEQVRRLAEWYNAKILYENQNVGLKKYFETMFCTHLLHPQPNIIKSISPNSRVNRQYGIHMTGPIKDELEIMTRDWLKTELEPGIMQLTKIMSIPLIKELIAYNKDGNFDRVISFMLCVLQDTEMHKIKIEETKEIFKTDNFFSKRLFTNEKRPNNGNSFKDFIEALRQEEQKDLQF